MNKTKKMRGKQVIKSHWRMYSSGNVTFQLKFDDRVQCQTRLTEKLKQLLFFIYLERKSDIKGICIRAACLTVKLVQPQHVPDSFLMPLGCINESERLQ